LTLAALLALAGGGAHAQSLLQLYPQAQGYDAAVQSASAQLQASQARAEQARAGLLPQLGLQAGAQHNWVDTSVGSLGSNSSFNVLTAGLVGSQPCTAPPTASPGTRASAPTSRRASTWPALGRT
jgi:outer membrane protein